MLTAAEGWESSKDNLWGLLQAELTSCSSEHQRGSRRTTNSSKSAWNVNHLYLWTLGDTVFEYIRYLICTQMFLFYIIKTQETKLFPDWCHFLFGAGNYEHTLLRQNSAGTGTGTGTDRDIMVTWTRGRSRPCLSSSEGDVNIDDSMGSHDSRHAHKSAHQNHFRTPTGAKQAGRLLQTSHWSHRKVWHRKWCHSLPSTHHNQPLLLPEHCHKTKLLLLLWSSQEATMSYNTSKMCRL